MNNGFDFSKCKIVGPESASVARQGSAWINAVSAEVLACRDAWLWKDKGPHILRPWDEGVSVLSADRKYMLRYCIEADIEIKDGDKWGKNILRRCSHIYYPDLSVSREFYGCEQVPWRYVGERIASCDREIGLEFIEPDDGFVDMYQSVGLARTTTVGMIKESWRRHTEEMRECLNESGVSWRLRKEAVRFFLFDKLICLKYAKGSFVAIGWFNSSNHKVFIKSIDK